MELSLLLFLEGIMLWIEIIDGKRIRVSYDAMVNGEGEISKIFLIRLKICMIKRLLIDF